MRSSDGFVTLTRAYTDALEAALRRVIADFERQAEVQRDKADALIAGLSARLAETEVRCAALEAELRRAVEDRLATVRDGADCDMAAVMARVDEVLAAIPAPKDGVSVEPAEVRSMVEAAVAALPVPEADPADLDCVVSEHVARAVAALPPAAPGRDADPEEMRAAVAEAVEAAVAALPVPEVDPVELERLVSEHVARAVAALPPAEPGRDADPEEMRAAVAEAVKAAVAALPVPADGKDADPAMIAEMIREALPDPEELRGPPGRLPLVRVWTDGVWYEGDVVAHDGATWQALRDTGKAPGGEDWVRLAAAGAPGDPGRSMAHRGTYDAAGKYWAQDVVAKDGSSFVAKVDDPGPCPGEGWQLVASRGGRGAPGKSVKGDPGNDAAEVVGFYRDGEEMVMTFADGREMRA